MKQAPAACPRLRVPVRMIRFFFVFLTLGLCLTAPSFAGDIYKGKVERVIDGDTIQLLTDDYEQVRVRLYGIDAPERDQEGGAQSTSALKNMIDGRRVTVDVLDVDRYSRLVGLIEVDGVSANLQLIELGVAWVYESYCKVRDVCQEFREAQNRAQRSRQGLWANPDAKPPWEHRRDKRK